MGDLALDESRDRPVVVLHALEADADWGGMAAHRL